MARSLSNAAARAIHALADAEAFLWIAEIPAIGGGEYRLCEGREHLVVGGKQYLAGLSAVRIPVEDIEGSLGDAEIAVPNVSRVALAAIDSDDQILGQNVTLRLVYTGDTATIESGFVYTYRALGARVTAREVTLRLGHAADIERIPSQVYDRKRFPGIGSGGGVS